jgi:hypothetical protein
MILLSNLIETKLAIAEIVASYIGLVLLADSRIRDHVPHDFVAKGCTFSAPRLDLCRWKPTLLDVYYCLVKVKKILLFDIENLSQVTSNKTDVKP